MKRYSLPVTAMACLLMATGCSEKFDVAAPYKDITVVNGYLDMRDTAHYVRIQKAFLDENTSAITMAQTSDSNFYAGLNVRIDRLTFNKTKVDSIHLNRVDLTAEGYPKQAGVFFNAPNYAYKFTNTLDPNYIYRMVITNVATGKVDSVETPVINTRNANVFRVDVIDDSSAFFAGMDFASTSPNQRVQIKGYYVKPTNFADYGQSSPMVVAQTIVRFNWVDSQSNGTKTSHYFDFNAGYLLLTFDQFDYRIANTTMYNAVKTGIGAAPANTYRLMNRCDVFVYGGTQDYYNYQQANLTKGVGLTGNEIQPVYTNVKGKDVLGLFTARGYRSGPLTITKNTIDSLKVSQLTRDLRITGTVYR